MCIKWIRTIWLMIIIALAGSASSMAGPWADRAIAGEQLVQNEQTCVIIKSSQRRLMVRRSSNAVLPVVTPENTLRPGVVRRLSRRGISVEELESLTAAGKAEQVANGRGTAYRQSVKMATKPKYGRMPVHNLLEILKRSSAFRTTCYRNDCRPWFATAGYWP